MSKKTQMRVCVCVLRVCVCVSSCALMGLGGGLMSSKWKHSLQILSVSWNVEQT
jgi:hypothetical protein